MAKSYNKKMSGSAYNHYGKIPATISNDDRKHANLPTDVMMENYPSTMYMGQYVGDSIVSIDAQINSGVRGSMKQKLDKKY